MASPPSPSWRPAERAAAAAAAESVGWRRSRSISAISIRNRASRFSSFISSTRAASFSAVFPPPPRCGRGSGSPGCWCWVAAFGPAGDDDDDDEEEEGQEGWIWMAMDRWNDLRGPEANEATRTPPATDLIVVTPLQDVFRTFLLSRS